MLAKLLKYEFKATARWFIPIYAALILFALISRVLLHNDPFVLKEASSFLQIAVFLSMFIYVFLFIGIMVVTLVVMIQRFYKSLLGDEGYLMFTLPVQTWKHLVNKLLIAILWNLLSAAIGMVSIMLLVPAQELKELGSLLMYIKEYLGTMGYFSIPLLFLASIVFSIVQMYTAIAMGQLFRKHKLLASFGMYIGINTVSQIVFILIILFFQYYLTSLSGPVPSLHPSHINMLILVTGIILAVLTAVCFIVTNIILKRRLNLE